MITAGADTGAAGRDSAFPSGIGSGGCYGGGFSALYRDGCAPRAYCPPAVVYRPVYVAPPPVVYCPAPAAVYAYPAPVPCYPSGGYVSTRFYYGR